MDETSDLISFSLTFKPQPHHHPPYFHAHLRPLGLFLPLEDDEDDDDEENGEGTLANGSSSSEDELPSSFCAAASSLRLTDVGMPFSCALLRAPTHAKE